MSYHVLSVHNAFFSKEGSTWPVSWIYPSPKFHVYSFPLKKLIADHQYFKIIRWQQKIMHVSTIHYQWRKVQKFLTFATKSQRILAQKFHNLNWWRLRSYGRYIKFLLLRTITVFLIRVRLKCQICERLKTCSVKGY